jgi:cysteine-S-conjugate beta-lyase
MRNDDAKKSQKLATRVAHAGRHPERFAGAVNPPIFHASTILSPTMADWEEKKKQRARDEIGTYYGRFGTPGTQAFEEVITELQGGHRTLLYPSGLAACTGATMSYLAAGDHLLMPDNVYGPTRHFCDTFLKRFGVTTTYYDPSIGAGIDALMRSNTRVVFTESPGSHSFEVQDIPAIAAVAHRHGAVVLMDNTWATPLYFDAIGHGVDVVIHSGTKYIVGHSDALIGTATMTKEAWGKARDNHTQVGFMAGPNDVYFALRGLRTMSVRLKQHWETGLQLAEWFMRQPEVERVLHPALPSDPGYALWKRDFTGASGLFGVAFKSGVTPQAMAALIDALELYGLGASWGGFESLVMPTEIAKIRTATKWAPSGLEAIDDLIADMANGFAALRA